MFPVRTKEVQDFVHEVCLECNDDWALKVLARLEFARDLHAADAIYHQQCSVNFQTKKQIPQSFDEGHCAPKRKGKPQDLAQSDAFLKVAKFLEDNDDEQITVGKVTDKMNEYLEADNESGDWHGPYTVKHMKRMLIERFGECGYFQA